MSCHQSDTETGDPGKQASINYPGIFRDGLWDNNVVTGQLLALCPLLAVTTSATNGLGMGIASMSVLLLTNGLISLARGIILPQVRIPILIVLIATAVTLVDMAINAWLHDLYKVLGLFIPLIVTNCAIFGRAESFASRQPLLPALLDATAMGLGFTWVLVMIGGIREILGSGTLFAHASLLLSDHFAWLETRLFKTSPDILLAILPPGAFIALGLLIVVKRLVDQALKKTSTAPLVQLQS